MPHVGNLFPCRFFGIKGIEHAKKAGAENRHIIDTLADLSKSVFLNSWYDRIDNDKIMIGMIPKCKHQMNLRSLSFIIV